MGVRIRPASALSVILAIAFTLELLAVLSVPVTRSITLCTYQNIQFGVFGYCDTTTNTCSDIGIGYNNVTSVEGFSLPSNARHTLANLLIVHVVAAGLTLILLVLTLFAHLHTASHSSKYLLFILILSLPCFLLSLLAFLVDILLFVPHLDWGGWIVLAATVLIALFGVLLCIMRRTMSSRKAMKRHGNENSELQNLNQFNSYSAYMPDGGMVYGGEAVNKPQQNNEFNEFKYENSDLGPGRSLDQDDNVPLNSRNQNPNIYAGQNQNGNYPNDLDHQPYYPGNNFNQYEDFRQQTPSPSRDYRTPEYAEYADYRGTGTPVRAGDHGVPDAAVYSQVSPSAVAAAAATAGTVGGTTVAVAQGPQRRAQAHQAIPEGIIPAGTYGSEYDDGASMSPDAYREFGGNIVPLPKIQNPDAITPQQPYEIYNDGSLDNYQTPLPQPSGPSRQQSASPHQRQIVAPQVAQQGYVYDSSNSSLPAGYETASSSKHDITDRDNNLSYAPPRPAWRNQSQSSQSSHNPNDQQSIQASDQYQQPHSRQQKPQQQQPQQQQPQAARSSPSSNYNPAVPSRHQDLRQKYVSQEDDDQFYELPQLDASHLQTLPHKTSAQSLDAPTSPAISDSSHFTSISQRPINPKYFQQPASSRKAASDRTDFVLASNPDFQLPGASSGNKMRGPKPVIAAQPPFGGSNVSPGPRARPGQSKTQGSSTLDEVLGAKNEGPYGASRGI